MRQGFAWLFAIAVAAVPDHAWVLCCSGQSASTKEARTFARV